MVQTDRWKRKRTVERHTIKALIREAKYTVKKMKSSESVSSLAGHTWVEGNIVMVLERQRVRVAVDERLQRR
jgi:hypothetical protein